MSNEIAHASETPIWEGGPSQLINANAYLASAVVAGLIVAIQGWFDLSATSLAALVFPLGYAGWQYLTVKRIRYVLTSQRLKVRSGVLNVKAEEIELYRVKDFQLLLPIHLRLFGLGNVHLLTSDKSQPSVTLEAIPDGPELKDAIRDQVERLRQTRGVRELDV